MLCFREEKMPSFAPNKQTPLSNQSESRISHPAFLISFSMIFILLLSCSFITSLLQNPTPASSHTPESMAAQTQEIMPLPTVTATIPPTMISTSYATPYATLDQGLPPIGLFQPVTAFANLKGNRIRQLNPFPFGDFGIVTDQAVAMFHGTNWLWYLPEIEGDMVGQDKDQRVWVVSGDGSEITAWDGTTWIAYGSESGWLPIHDYHEGSIGQDLITDATGNIWLTTDHDVRTFNGDAWRVFTSEEMNMDSPESEDVLRQFSLHSLQTRNEIWVASCDWLGPGPIGGAGLRRFDGQMWHDDITPPTPGCILEIAEDDQGKVWVGVDQNLWRYNPITANWTSYAPPLFSDDGRLGYITDMTNDDQGRLWTEFAICGGASCFTGSVRFLFMNGSWTQIGDVDTTGYEGFLVFDSFGTPWQFRGDGIYRIAKDVPERVADLVAEAVTVDPEGTPWFVARYDGQWVLYTLGVYR
jgi:hypothetical protein